MNVEERAHLMNVDDLLLISHLNFLSMEVAVKHFKKGGKHEGKAFTCKLISDLCKVPAGEIGYLLCQRYNLSPSGGNLKIIGKNKDGQLYSFDGEAESIATARRKSERVDNNYIENKTKLEKTLEKQCDCDSCEFSLCCKRNHCIRSDSSD